MTMSVTSVLETRYNDVFDVHSEDGFSRDALKKLVSVIAFLMEHYREIPEDLFKHYLEAASDILTWKGATYPDEKRTEIPPKLREDMVSIFAP